MKSISKCLYFGFVADGVPKEGLRIQDVLVRLAILHLIRDKVD
jgi:chromodomain-helicase-DNA-binding protein 4